MIMDENMKSIRIIDNRKCIFYEKGHIGPIVLCCGMKEQEKQAEEIWQLLTEKIENLFFIYYMAEDWNDMYSPWKAPKPFEEGYFSGEAGKTLQWIEKGLFGLISAEYGQWLQQGQIYLAGYSLAGLFSLWSVWNSSLFTGIACCSGSLWYEHLPDYAKEREVLGEKIVYLSLGDKEGKTKNPVLSQVDECTGKIESILKNSPKVSEITLEWNPGGHFKDVPQRIAAGILWLCGG